MRLFYVKAEIMRKVCTSILLLTLFLWKCNDWRISLGKLSLILTWFAFDFLYYFMYDASCKNDKSTSQCWKDTMTHTTGEKAWDVWGHFSIGTIWLDVTSYGGKESGFWILDVDTWFRAFCYGATRNQLGKVGNRTPTFAAPRPAGQRGALHGAW